MHIQSRGNLYVESILAVTTTPQMHVHGWMYTRLPLRSIKKRRWDLHDMQHVSMSLVLNGMRSMAEGSSAREECTAYLAGNLVLSPRRLR